MDKPSTEKSTLDLKDEAKQMARAQSSRHITLESLRQRFKCTGGEVFAVLQGQVLEGDLRDKLYAFLLPPPAAAEPAAPPATVAPPPAPVAAEVVDLITKPSARGKAPRPPVGEPYRPPQPDPVAPVEVTPRPLQRMVGTPESINPLPGQAPSGRLEAAPAAPAPATAPESPKVASPEPGKVEPPIYRVPGAGEKSIPEVGARIRAAMKAKEFSCETLAPFFGHKTGSNISASLSKSGSRRFQIRLCQFFGLDGDGLAVPGWTENREIPKPGIAPTTLAAQLPDARLDATAARAAAATRVPGHVLRLPRDPRNTAAVSPTMLTDAQTGAALELARAADELNRLTRERNHAATRYKNALSEAEAVGVRFATTA